MIRDQIVKDELLKYLISNSNLTEVQLDTILSDLRGASLKEMIEFRDKAVSKGSFVRTLKQAKDNISASLFTILLLSYVGYSSGEEISVFVKLTELINKAGGKKGIVRILREMVSRLVK